jgi:ketosteroid isomerase-like protein
MGRKFESCRAHQKNKIKILNSIYGADCVVVKMHCSVIAASEAQARSNCSWNQNRYGDLTTAQPTINASADGDFLIGTAATPCL